jgi:hypothetical protein
MANSPLNVEVLGDGDVFVRINPVSAAVDTTLASDAVQMLGYEWTFCTQRTPGQDFIHLLVCAPEFYDEFHCSKNGSRHISATVCISTIEHETRYKFHQSVVAEMTPEYGFKTRNYGVVCRLLNVAEAKSVEEDTLDLTCHIELRSPTIVPPLPFSRVAEPEPDFTLTFDNGKTLHVHKLVLQLASPVFAALLSDLPDSRTLHLQEDPLSMHLLLSFIYPVTPKPSLTLRTANHVCKLADKYDVTAAVAPHICSLFHTTYSFSDEPESLAYVISWLQHADSLGMPELVEQCIDYLYHHSPQLAWGEDADVAGLQQVGSATLAKLLLRARKGLM